MKVVHLNNADTSGGAAIAAFRIHQSLLDRKLHSRMWVNNAKSGNWTVSGPKGKWRKAIAQMRRHLVIPLLRTTQTQNKILHSPAILPSSSLPLYLSAPNHSIPPLSRRPSYKLSKLLLSLRAEIIN